MENQTPLDETPDDNTPITKPKRRMVLTEEQRKERADRMREMRAQTKKARELEISIREEKALDKLEKIRSARVAKYGKTNPTPEAPPPPAPTPEPIPEPTPVKKSKPAKKVKKIIIQQSSESESESEEEIVVISSKKKEKPQSITKSKTPVRPNASTVDTEPRYTFKFV
jgi:hypothetical protein